MLNSTYTASKLSADQITQFAGAVGLEITLDSYGLLANLLLRAGAVSSLGVRGQLERSLFLTPARLTVADSVASEFSCSMPTASTLTTSNVCEGTVQTGEVQKSICADQLGELRSMDVITTSLGQKHQLLSEFSVK